MVRSGGDVTANCGAVGVMSIASESVVRGGFVKVADTSIGPGGGFLRGGLKSGSNRDGLLVKEVALLR